MLNGYDIIIGHVGAITTTTTADRDRLHAFNDGDDPKISRPESGLRGEVRDAAARGFAW